MIKILLINFTILFSITLIYVFTHKTIRNESLKSTASPLPAISTLPATQSSLPQAPYTPPPAYLPSPTLPAATPKPTPTPTQPAKIQLFSEKIPGSKFRNPDSTWWGYNQTKIARFKDLVFTYVIENSDEDTATSSLFTVYKKNGNNPWEKGASFSTSRPGNLLVDSLGTLHAFVFEPTDIKKNDSIGKLKHYYFLDAKDGDIQNFKEELIVDNDGINETVNIRVGAAISKDDMIAVAFGLTKYNPVYKGQ